MWHIGKWRPGTSRPAQSARPPAGKYSLPICQIFLTYMSNIERATSRWQIYIVYWQICFFLICSIFFLFSIFFLTNCLCGHLRVRDLPLASLTTCTSNIPYLYVKYSLPALAPAAKLHDSPVPELAVKYSLPICQIFLTCTCPRCQASWQSRPWTCRPAPKRTLVALLWASTTALPGHLRQGGTYR